jgi:hypothetical protein
LISFYKEKKKGGGEFQRYLIHILKVFRIEVKVEGINFHKCDGIMSIMDDCEKSTMMLVKFAYGFGERDAKKLQSDTDKIHPNAARLLS